MTAASGAADATFGNAGRTDLDVGTQHDEVLSIAVDGSGRIVVAGFTEPTTNAARRQLPFVARLSPAGTFDPTFGTNGVVVFDFSDGTAITEGYDTAVAVFVDAAGRPTVAGYTNETVVGADKDTNRAVVARFDASGHLDPLFGNGGKLSFTDPQKTIEVLSAAVQPDGKLLVLGLVDQGSMIARIIP